MKRQYTGCKYNCNTFSDRACSSYCSDKIEEIRKQNREIESKIAKVLLTIVLIFYVYVGIDYIF